MKGNSYPNVEVFRQTNWNETTCYRLGQKKNRKWRESFVIFMFIANKSFLSRLNNNFFTQVNSSEGVLPNDEF